MSTRRRTRTARGPAALAALLLAVLGWALPGTSQAAPAPPQLSIAVDDGQPSAVASDRLTYVLTVSNLGTRRVENLVVTQTVPAGADLESSDPRSTGEAPDPSWTVDVQPGKTVTMKTTVVVAESLPDDLLRLASVSCARTSAKAAPLVCASDSDQLPAGAAADEQRQTPEQASTDDGGWWPLPGAVALGGLLLAAVIGTLLLLRRRGGSRPPGTTGSTDARRADLVPGSR